MVDLFVNSQESDSFQTNLNTPTEKNDTTPFTFTASTNQITHLADTFSAITTINSLALMIIRTSGITIYAEYNHVCNVQLTIDPSLFQIYSFYSNKNEPSQVDSQQELRFGVDIGLISEAFQSVANSSISKKTKVDDNDNKNRINESVSCYMTYNYEGGLFVVEFEDSLINEKIEFFTFYSDIFYPYDNYNPNSIGTNEENFDLIISHDEIQYELMMKSDVLSILLQDLQKINTTDLFIYVSNEYKSLGSSKSKNILDKNLKSPKFVDNQLNFISKGPIGFSKLIYPNEKTILEKLMIFENDGNSNIRETHTSLISSFNFSIFIRIFKAVKLSSKCKVLKDFRGILSIQLLCKNSNTGYSGTLIKFNMLEALTQTNEDVYSEHGEGVYLNDIFDDEAYDYIKHYNQRDLKQSMNDYTSLDLNTSKFDFQNNSILNPFERDQKRNKSNNTDGSKKGNSEHGIDVPLFL